MATQCIMHVYMTTKLWKISESLPKQSPLGDNVKPGLHSQRYEPNVFVQVPSEHIPGLRTHSSTSAKIIRM